MMNDSHGDGVTPLQSAQEGEQRSDLTADILVDAMQPDEGIKDEEPRLERRDGLLETRAIGVEIEAQAGCGDHLDVEVGQGDAGGSTDTLKAAADDVQS